jgi:hypothetical protein
MNSQITRLALGAWCNALSMPAVWEVDADFASAPNRSGPSSEASAAVPMPVAPRPRKYRRVS